MYFQESEHHPPHFHVTYGGYEAEFAIETGDILAGRIPLRPTRLIRKWLAEHRPELQEIWDTQIFIKIKPLE